jgi:hypothetical protein
MNYRLPANVKADINRIAAIQTDDPNLQILIDRILIGYTYFLPPQQYMDMSKVNSEDRHLAIPIFSNFSDRSSLSNCLRADVRFMPIHPLIDQMLEKYEGLLPGISHVHIAPLYKQLFPDASESGSGFFRLHMHNFSILRKVLVDDEITQIEGLSWYRLFILRGFKGPKSAITLEKLFKQPFFNHLKIRVNANASR